MIRQTSKNGSIASWGDLTDTEKLLHLLENWYITECYCSIFWSSCLKTHRVLLAFRWRTPSKHASWAAIPWRDLTILSPPCSWIEITCSSKTYFTVFRSFMLTLGTLILPMISWDPLLVNLLAFKILRFRRIYAKKQYCITLSLSMIKNWLQHYKENNIGYTRKRSHKLCASKYVAHVPTAYPATFVEKKNTISSKHKVDHWSRFVKCILRYQYSKHLYTLVISLEIESTCSTARGKQEIDSD